MRRVRQFAPRDYCFCFFVGIIMAPTTKTTTTKTANTLAKSSVVKASSFRILQKFCKGRVKLPPPKGKKLSMDEMRAKLDEWHAANGGYTKSE